MKTIPMYRGFSNENSLQKFTVINIIYNLKVYSYKHKFKN